MQLHEMWSIKFVFVTLHFILMVKTQYPANVIEVIRKPKVFTSPPSRFGGTPANPTLQYFNAVLPLSLCRYIL